MDGNEVKYDIQAATQARFTSNRNKTETYVIQRPGKNRGVGTLVVKKKGFADKKIKPSLLDGVKASKSFTVPEDTADLLLALRTGFAADALALTTKQKCPPQKKKAPAKKK